MKLTFLFQSLIGFIIILGAVSAGKTPKKVVETGFTIAKVPFVFEYKELVEICDEYIVSHSGEYFDNWIIQFLKDALTDTPAVLFDDIDEEVGKHKDAIKKYLDTVISKQKTVPKYSALALEIEVADLLEKIGSITKTPYVPRYSTEMPTEGNGSVEIPKIADFIKSVKDTPLTVDSIDRVATLLKKINDLPEDSKAKAVYQPVIEYLKEDVEETLYQILAVALNEPNDKVFSGLPSDQVALLQSFFNDFMFVGSLPEFREAILTTLTSSPEEPNFNGEFFTPELFKSLTGVPSNFEDVFVFDEFILTDLDRVDLKKIHEAAKRFQFQREFPSQFNTAFTDLELDIPDVDKIQTPEARRKRHNAKVERLAYIVSAFPRKSGSIASSPPVSLPEFLTELFNWTVDTPIFDPEPEQPIQANEGEAQVLTKSVPAEHRLIAPHDFRKNFLPLLSWICHRIPGCDLFQKREKPIVEKFKKFGNVRHFETEKEELEGSVPQDILDRFKELTVEAHIKDVAENLPNIKTFFRKPEQKMRNQKAYRQPPKLEDEEVVTEIEMKLGSEQPTSPNKLQVVEEEPVQNILINEEEDLPVTAALTEEERKEMEEGDYKVFSEELAPKIFALDAQEDAPLNPKFLEIVLETGIDSANKDFSDRIRKAAVKYLTLKAMKTPAIAAKNRGPMQKFSGHFITDFREGYDFLSTIGMRNFLMYNYANLRRVELTAKVAKWDQFLFLTKMYDMIFFIDFAVESYVAAVEKGELTDPKDGSIRSVAVIEAKQAEYQSNLPPAIKGDFEKIRSKILTNPFFMDKIHSFNLMVKFLDFFDFFEKLQKANANYLNYQSVFVNFYDFMISLRFQTKTHQAQPYQYVLDNIHACLQYTDRPQDFVKDKRLGEMCNLSHRKYAEMLYFVRLYLLSKSKLVETNLQPYEAGSFDTHVRMFLALADQFPEYGSAFKFFCEKENEKAPVCTAANIYKRLNYQLSKTDVIRLDLDSEEFADFDLTDSNNKITLINGIDTAIVAASERGNIKDYEKLIGRFDIFKNGSAFKLGSADIPALTTYLKRTFRKAVFAPWEGTISRVVQTILRGKEDLNPQSDSLKAFLLYNGVIIPDFLKAFLIYAQTEQEFERIARIIVEEEMDSTVAKLNSPANNKFIIDVTSALQHLSETEALDKFREKLHEQYAGAWKTCRNVFKYGLMSEAENTEEWNFIDDLMGQQDEETEQTVQAESNSFKKLESELGKDMKTLRVVTTSFTIPVTQDENEERLKKNMFEKKTLEAAYTDSRDFKLEEASDSEMLKSKPISPPVNLTTIYRKATDLPNKPLTFIKNIEATNFSLDQLKKVSGPTGNKFLKSQPQNNDQEKNKLKKTRTPQQSDDDELENHELL